ncbi:MAG: winged helix-turn-helix domain-containing protein [Candidatus Micrarchaeota archaeon]|nr:winged helix-turn-helix domain-containing protein [Candidatus Micrarchaeota archaeon]
MRSNQTVQNIELYRKIRVLANSFRFRIIELTTDEKISITKLSSILKLSYTKCADYVRMLEKEGLVKKTRVGKEVMVESKISLISSGLKIEK